MGGEEPCDHLVGYDLGFAYGGDDSLDGQSGFGVAARLWTAHGSALRWSGGEDPGYRQTVSSLTIVSFDGPKEFLTRAEPWLLRAEVENNIVLSVASAIITSPDRFKRPIFLATVEGDGAVVGCAFRTPPFKVGLTTMPREAVPLVVGAVGTVYPSIPGVIGPEPLAIGFAEQWTARMAGSFAVERRQRLYVLEEVVAPSRRARGAARSATTSDVDLVTEWAGAFVQEIGGSPEPPGALAKRLVEPGDACLWEDGEPVSIAACAGRTPNGARVSLVYTPPELRGKGYATTLVADVTRRLLGQGNRYCFLYTDLANPTSNWIYQEVGYRPVHDVVELGFNG